MISGSYFPGYILYVSVISPLIQQIVQRYQPTSSQHMTKIIFAAMLKLGCHETPHRPQIQRYLTLNKQQEYLN